MHCSVNTLATVHPYNIYSTLSFSIWIFLYLLNQVANQRNQTIDNMNLLWKRKTATQTSQQIQSFCSSIILTVIIFR